MKRGFQKFSSKIQLWISVSRCMCDAQKLNRRSLRFDYAACHWLSILSLKTIAVFTNDFSRYQSATSNNVSKILSPPSAVKAPSSFRSTKFRMTFVCYDSVSPSNLYKVHSHAYNQFYSTLFLLFSSFLFLWRTISARRVERARARARVLWARSAPSEAPSNGRGGARNDGELASLRYHGGRGMRLYAATGPRNSWVTRG